MARILSLETSTDVCSVAVHDDGNLIAESVIREPRAQASRLAPMIEEVLTAMPAEMSTLDAVAITSGPGSYTGLRIGTSTAKGICYSLDIPLISISTLDLLAFEANRDNHNEFYLCPLIDARRMEVYCKVLSPGMQTICQVEAKVIDDESFKELLSHQKMLFFGNGSEKCKSVIKHQNAYFIDNISPLASSLGILAETKFLTKEFEDLENYAPHYLKEFVAKKAQPLF
jgi:tRNA threonylcarbamoyladenosine biosynthesis protein TsaB